MTEATYIIVDKLEDLEGYTGKKDHTKFYCHEENIHNLVFVFLYFSPL